MGASKFEWTDGGAQSFTTDLHVQQQVPDKNRPTHTAESLDGSVIESISVGSGQNQIVVNIEHERDDAGLRDFRDAARRSLSLTFTPDVDAAGTTFTVTAAPPVPEIIMVSEGRQSPRYALRGLILRRLDGGAFLP